MFLDFNNISIIIENFLGLQFWSAGEDHSPEGDTCSSPDSQHVTIETYTTGHDPHQNRTINYSYDELYRLTDAEYDENLYFRYQYDAVGNRLQEIKRLGFNLPEVVNSYTYDEANRMTSLNGVNYIWDANGNLLNDGETSYTYNSSNHLVAVTKGETISQYTYNGLGDRVQQIVNGVTTDYVLDINTGLTQVLQDGTNTYLYGINRVAQTTAEQAEFFLADALGSVRNLTDSSGVVTLTQSYTPFGEILESFGDGSTDYNFTGEMYDPNTGLVFLRARYYQPSVGRFTSRDLWDGDNQMPMSYNSWLYVYANPINYVDSLGEEPEAANPCNDQFRYCQLINFNNAVIDVHHFYDSRDLAKEIMGYLETGKGIENHIFTLTRTIKKIAPYWKMYSTSIPTTIFKEEKVLKGVALGIFMNFQFGLEQFEGLSSFFPFLCTDGNCSGFSNEDLPTDYLGFIAWVEKGGWSINDVSTKFGGGMGLDKLPHNFRGTSKQGIECAILGNCDEENPYNDCWEFKIPIDNGNFQYIPWPQDLLLDPINEGKYWHEYVPPLTITY